MTNHDDDKPLAFVETEEAQQAAEVTRTDVARPRAEWTQSPGLGALQSSDADDALRLASAEQSDESRPAVRRMELTPGATFGQYELIRELGHGGMGAVFLARDTRLGRRVAIKFMLDDSPARVARFLSEARVTARCEHEYRRPGPPTSVFPSSGRWRTLTRAVFALLNRYPLASILMAVALALVFVFLVTSVDSATYVLGMLTSHGSHEPPTSRKLGWGFSLAILGGAMIAAGRMDVVRSSAILGAIPFVLIIQLQVVALIRDLRKPDAIAPDAIAPDATAPDPTDNA